MFFLDFHSHVRFRVSLSSSKEKGKKNAEIEFGTIECHGKNKNEVL